MKISRLAAILTITALIVWAGTCVALSQRGIPSHEHRSSDNPAYRAQQQKISLLKKQSNIALSRNDYANAERLARQAINLDNGQNCGLWIDLARALDRQERTGEAFDAYSRAFNPPPGSGGTSTFPSDVAAEARYGILCDENGQHEEAIRAYNEAVEHLNPVLVDVPLKVSSDPRSTPATQLKALLKVVQGLTLEEESTDSGRGHASLDASEAFQEAAQEQPNDPRVQFYLGRGLRKAGRFAEAQAALEKAARLDTEGTVKAAAAENLRAVQAHRR